LASQTNPAVDYLFGLTGRPVDDATDLRNHLHRWTNPRIADWMSPDPILFTAGQTNLRAYCQNSPTNLVDPTGLWVYAMEVVRCDHCDESRPEEHNCTHRCSLRTEFFYAPNYATAVGVAKAACGKLVPLGAMARAMANHCHGDPTLEQEVATLLTVSAKTYPRLGPGGMCYGWMNDFLSAIPPEFREGKTKLKVFPWEFTQGEPGWITAYVAVAGHIARWLAGGGQAIYLAPGHFAIKVRFPDKYEMYLDNGWAGTGGFFSYMFGPIPFPKEFMHNGIETSWPEPHQPPKPRR